MGCAWNQRATLFPMLLICGLTIYCIIYMSGDGHLRVQHLRDRSRPMIKPDLIITRNTTANATETGAGLVSCKDTRLMPKGTFPLIALASDPGSGNTWVRQLMESATGYATSLLKNGGFHGGGPQNFEGKALIIKTHYYKENLHVVGAILLLRNPYRAMLAEYNRRKAGKTGYAPAEEFKTAEWHRFVEIKARSWFNLYQAFISNCHHSGNTCKSTLVVYYEQLQLHLMDELRRILEYLHITIDEKRLACAVTNSEGQFHRSKRNTTLDPFSKEDRSFVDKSLNLYRDWIDQRELEQPPLSFSSYPSDL